MKIVVIGGTGLIGTKLVSRLRGKGHEVEAASPDTGVNSVTGEGVAAALELLHRGLQNLRDGVGVAGYGGPEPDRPAHPDEREESP